MDAGRCECDVLRVISFKVNQSKIVELELAYDVLLYAVHKSVQIVYRFQSQVILRVLFRVHPPNLSIFEQESQRLVKLARLLAH